MLNSKKRGFRDNVSYEKWKYPVSTLPGGHGGACGEGRRDAAHAGQHTGKVGGLRNQPALVIGRRQLYLAFVLSNRLL